MCRLSNVLLLLGIPLASAGKPSADPTLGWNLAHPMNGVSFQRPVALADPTQDRPSPRFSRLQKVPGIPGKRSAMSALGRAAHTLGRFANSTYQHVYPIGNLSAQYAIRCGWDGTPVWLLFDTGSSDTWAAREDVKCRSDTGASSRGDACGFGSPLITKFGHGPLTDLHFHLKYGDGEEVSGPMGRSDLSCGGLEVSKQQVGLANNTYWHGDNQTVGILGLAYSSITNAFYGDVGEEAEYNAVTYSPFFTSAVGQGSIDPVFSVAIMRNSSDGVLSWGGLPPMELHMEEYAQTDLIIANLGDKTETAWKHSFYTIVPDGVKWEQTTDMNKYPYIVDTGTTLMYLPPPLAEAIAMAFEPRAVYLYQWGGYFAPCEAIPPSFAFVISGVEFWIDPADMIYRDLVDPLTGYCSIALSTGGAGPYILGDVFLQNVLAVFDVGAAQMRFYPRK